MLEFEIPGAPVAKERAGKSPSGHFYTRSNTRNAQALVRLAAGEALGKGTPMEGPVSVTIVHHLPIPQSWSKTRKAMAADGVILPDKRPDIDNLVKTICDGANGVAYLDDKQICALHALKVYGTRPHTEVQVRIMDGGVDLEIEGEG